MTWWQLLLIATGATAAIYLCFIAWLLLTGRRQDARALAGFIPDCIDLFRRLLADPRVPRRHKLLLGALIGYLAMPIDLVPDFIPVAGQLDDAIIVALVLRTVLRAAGPDLCASTGRAPPPRATRCCVSPTDPSTPRRRVPEPAPSTAHQLLRRGLRLEYITLGWNVIGSVVVILAAITAKSVALAGFGLDSLIEIGASLTVVWQLNDTGGAREERALRLIGIAFIALAVYIAAQAAYTLITTSRPEHSTLGIVWTAVTCAVMLALAAGKSRTGATLNNRVLQTEGRVTLIDAYLAAAVLLGLTLNTTFGWWWADPIAGVVIVYYGLREGREALRPGP